MMIKRESKQSEIEVSPARQRKDAGCSASRSADWDEDAISLIASFDTRDLMKRERERK